MASGYLDNLISSFGDKPEGPDPGRLDGLIQFMRNSLTGDAPSLPLHLERMRARLREAHRDRQNQLEGRRGGLNPELTALLERNVASCAELESALARFAETPSEEQLQVCQSRVEEFYSTSDQLSALGRSSVPLCPRCGSSGTEPSCPSCQLDRLTPDPDFAEEEWEQAEVNPDFHAVYRAYTDVVEGKAGLRPLGQALQGLEFTLLEAQALLEQSVEEHPDDSERADLLRSVQGALEGVQRMHSVQQNRSTRELNQGWVQVFRGAATISRLLPELLGGQND